jgi:hypothetical protein
MISKVGFVLAFCLSSSAFACKLSPLGASYLAMKVASEKLVEVLPESAYIRDLDNVDQAVLAQVVDGKTCEVYKVSYSFDASCAVMTNAEKTAEACK